MDIRAVSKTATSFAAARRQVARLQSVLALAITALLLVSAPTPAEAQGEGQIYGSGEGRVFNYTCGPGRILIGLQGSAGIWVDNIQAICARVEAAGSFTDAAAEGPSFGNNRPQDKHVQCPAGYGITHAGVSMNDDQPHVGLIRLVCRELVDRRDGGSAELELRGAGNLDGYDGSFGVGSDPGGRILGHSVCKDSYANGVRGRAGEHVSAFGLICGAVPQVAPVIESTAGRTLGKRKKPGSSGSPFSALMNSESSFQAFNFPDRYIRHANWLGFVEPSGGNYGSIIYRMVPGLGGRCVSLESKDQPGHFLRHKDWRIRLSALDSDGNMRADATFCPLPGLASTTGISFEAISAAGHFIRHRNFELWLDRPDGSDQARNDSTFLAAPPGGAALGVR